MLRKTKDTSVSLWVKDVNGNYQQMTLTWLKKYLLSNPDIMLRCGLVARPGLVIPEGQEELPLPNYTPLAHAPSPAVKPIAPAGKPIRPAWMDVPRGNPKPPKAVPIVAAGSTVDPFRNPPKPPSVEPNPIIPNGVAVAKEVASFANSFSKEK